MTSQNRTRWFALIVICAGALMNVLDSTIVGVALPSIKADLNFSSTSLAWVVNAYLLTFGGFLLLGGRLGDLFGQRRLFVAGIALFTFTSLLCGLASSQGMLIASRAIQGFGGAVASAVALSLTVSMFVEPAERAKAMGVFGFVSAGGGSIGVLLGGVLTSVLDWHWIFLVNVPIGVTVCMLSLRVLPRDNRGLGGQQLDIAGAVIVTSALMLAVYAIITGNHAGWLSGQTLGLLLVAVLLLTTFVIVESRTQNPLVPLGMLRVRNLSAASGIGVLWAGAMFAFFFLSALYLQLVLGYTPLKVGLAFLPANAIMSGVSLGLSAKLVGRYGVKAPVATGLGLVGVGLLLFARAPVHGGYVLDILPSMILLGLGGGMALNPLLLAAMSDIEQSESGVASGVVNTAIMMGGALGLAVLTSAAASRTTHLLASGNMRLQSLLGGYHFAYLIGTAFALIAAALAAILLRAPGTSASQATSPRGRKPALAGSEAHHLLDASSANTAKLQW